VSSLQEYVRRRDFDRTPEPLPRSPQRAYGALRFVVQAHAARSLHYDLRLQVDDVLVSWAVPKGPSLDPKERRLAVLTEDHPLEYADFEGVIPQGEYGGGSVIVWDEGTWVPEGNPRAGLERGQLTFTLQGKKLRGRFHLTRTRRGDGAQVAGSSWLLIKARDAQARDGSSGAAALAAESVRSGRTLDDIARARATVRGEPVMAPGESPGLEPPMGARRAPFPRQRRPQLATLVSVPPKSAEFLHEAKLDGYRLLAEVRPGAVKLWTRGDRDFSEHFPALVHHLSALDLGEVLLDGEIVAFDERGKTSFQLLQNALGGKRSVPLVYVVFDLIHRNGYDLSNVPLIERKGLLSRLLAHARADSNLLRYSDHVLGSGPAFFAQACEVGLEGIVSKRTDAPYRGERTQAWLKCKCIQRQEVVIGGYTEPSGARSGLGALLIGLHDAAGQLRYAGKVGTGFSVQSLEELQQRLSKMLQKEAPFVDPPRGAAARGVHWVRPELVAEVAFTEVTTGGKLRHPSFQGLREDKPARDVSLEVPADPPPAPFPIPLTHPERVVYPGAGITKADLAAYYLKVADRMLPYVRDRLLTLVRCPGGEGKPCFFQKHASEGLPATILAYDESAPGAEAGVDRFVYVREAAGLVALVQVGVLEVHTGGAHIDHLDRPDQLVFDLDPDEDLSWAQLVEGALDVRDELEQLGLQSFVKTTGGKGLHVTVPLDASSDFGQAKDFSKALAERLVSRSPKRYVATASKQKRTGKIFIDYLRNARGASVVAPYSTRARSGAPVAVPVAWQELSRDVRGEFSLHDLALRLSQADPWQGFFDVKQSLTPSAVRALGLTARKKGR